MADPLVVDAALWPPQDRAERDRAWPARARLIAPYKDPAALPMIEVFSLDGRLPQWGKDRFR